MLALATVLRAWAATLPIFHHPDELWQYLEPAYHLAEGRWVTAWEYRSGIRSWVVPALIAAPMKVGLILAPDSDLYLLLPRLMWSGFSLIAVAAATLLGLRLSRLHGLIAGIVTAIWFELVYFGPRTLTEPLGMALTFGAAWLATRARDSARPYDFALAGAVMGAAFCVRFHYAPALLVLAVFACRADWRRAWVPLIAGGLAALAAWGLAEVMLGQVPFRWIPVNFQINVVEARSHRYGVEPPLWYFREIGRIWHLAAIPIVALALLGAWRYPALALAALVNLAAHSALAHKEYRFVILTTALTVLLAAIGTADVLRWLKSRRTRHVATGVALAGWAGASLYAATNYPFDWQWTAHHERVAALRDAGRVPDACGMAIYGAETLGAAYSLYRRDTPIYVPAAGGGPIDLFRYQSAFNVILTRARYAGDLGMDWSQRSCHGTAPWDLCVYTRPGNCTEGPSDLEINHVLERSDQ